jgi:hypothetical protein
LKRISKHLTYANVMSTMAVFLILGGGAAVAANQLGKNTVGTPQLKKNAVKAAKLADGSVSNRALGNGSVSLAKLAGDSVDSSKLVDGSVASGDLGANSVINSKLADSSVNAPKLAGDSVITGKLADSAVTTTKLAGDSVTNGKLANDAVTGSKIANSTISAVDIAGQTGTFTFNAPSIAKEDCVLQAVTVAGVDDNNLVIVTPPFEIMELNVSVTAGRAASNGFIRLNFCNPTVLAVDPPSAVYRFLTIVP